MFLSQRLLRYAPFLLSCFIFVSCGEKELLQRYKIDLKVTKDCRQTGMSMQQCEDVSELALKMRTASWYVEKREDGTFFSPQSSFTLTLEDGRILAGLYFVDNGQLTIESTICKGESGHCFVARSQSQEMDRTLNCLKLKDKSVIFNVKDNVIVGEIRVIQLTDPNCGTQQVSEIVTSFKGELAEETIFAREVNL